MNVLAAGVTLPFLDEVVVLLVVSVLIAYICIRIKLVPIVGFLLTGVVIGPSALGLVGDFDLINGMAEVGVILLLFTIGVEFSLEKLNRIRRMILIGGGLQVAVTVVVVTAILVPAGVSVPAAIFTGFLVSLGSTAIVLRLVADRNETDTPTGRFSLAILIFQDLAIILMVLLVPALGGTGGSTFAVFFALGESVLIVVVVLLAARKGVPWLLERVARTRREELFLLTVVTICFGTAWLTSLADVSLALGAFLAGLVVSESRFSTHALSEILPLRTLFNAVFFVSVGMLMDVSYLMDNIVLVLGVSLVVLIVKSVITAASVAVMRYPTRVAVTVGLGLSQIGEFSFVLERAGADVGLSPGGLGSEGVQLFIAVTVVLMAITPVLMQIAPRLGSWFSARLSTAQNLVPSKPAPPSGKKLEDHVIVLGYGASGERLASVLSESGLPFVILELNPQLARDAEKEGYEVIIGDACRAHTMEEAGIDRAKLCVILLNDEEATARVTEMARFRNPTVEIIVRTRFLAQIEVLQKAGADIVIPEELETSVRIFTHVLQAYLITPDEIGRHIAAIRSGDYKVFRGSVQEAHLMVLQGLDEEGLHTRAVAVRKGSPVAGKTLDELGLRKNYNFTVLAVRRLDRTFGNPSADFRVEAGDRLVLVGTADQFVECAALFREPVKAES